MKKYLYLGIAAVLAFFSVKAQGNVCFIADTDCQGGQVYESDICDSNVLTHEWKLKNCFIYEAAPSCNDDLGNWYGVTACADGFPPLDEKHYCLDHMECANDPSNPALECCPDGRHRCRDQAHGDTFHFCTNNSYGVDGDCEDDETTPNNKKWRRCICDRSVYKYTCSSSALSGSGESCTGDDGITYYETCTCAPGYSEVLTNSLDFNCNSCTSADHTGDCTVPSNAPNEAKPGYTCINGAITCDYCPYSYNLTCSGTSGVGPRCGYGCFGSGCSSGWYADCSCAGYNLSSPVSGASCSSCDSASGTWYSCSCPSGYSQVGSECVADVDCTGYDLSSCPSNAICSDCNDGTTHYKKTGCKSGYHEDSSGNCVEDDDDDDEDDCTYSNLTCPSHAYCLSCTSGGTTYYDDPYACETGYTLNGSSCEKDEEKADCSDYPLSTCPSNASCSVCNDGSNHYRKDGCNIGYHEENGQCVQDETWPDCSDYPLTTCPANASCSQCTDGDGTHYKKDGCDDGYHDVNGSCVAWPDCSDYTFSASIANASCPSCTDQNGTHYSCSCNSGYTLKGGSCEKECGANEELQNGQCVCKSGYVKNNSGSCVPQPTCDSGQDLVNGKCVCKSSFYPYNHACSHGNPISCTDSSGTHWDCQCDQGYELNSNGDCIADGSCPIGDVYEHYLYSNGKIHCQEDLVNLGNGCYCCPVDDERCPGYVEPCPSGYYRDSSGNCVKPSTGGGSGGGSGGGGSHCNCDFTTEAAARAGCRDGAYLPYTCPGQDDCFMCFYSVK